MFCTISHAGTPLAWAEDRGLRHLGDTTDGSHFRGNGGVDRARRGASCSGMVAFRARNPATTRWSAWRAAIGRDGAYPRIGHFGLFRGAGVARSTRKHVNESGSGANSSADWQSSWRCRAAGRLQCAIRQAARWRVRTRAGARCGYGAPSWPVVSISRGSQGTDLGRGPGSPPNVIHSLSTTCGKTDVAFMQPSLGNL